MILNSQYKNSSSFPMDIKLNGKDVQLNKSNISSIGMETHLYFPLGTLIPERNIIFSCANNMLFVSYNQSIMTYSENEGNYWTKASFPTPDATGHIATNVVNQALIISNDNKNSLELRELL